MQPQSSVHAPVLPAEVMSFLAVRPGMRVVDGTLGGGGHTRLFAEAVGPTGLVVAIDRDPAAIDRGARELAGLPVRFAQANFCDLPEVLDALAIDRVDRVLLDVGLSSDQLADASRGFSFDADGPLDLRFDPTEGEPAWRIVARMRPESLADILFEFGEERYSRRIARRIAAVREQQPIRSSRDLARVVAAAVPRQHPPPRIHPATRTFQALRIHVNGELDELVEALHAAERLLPEGGSLVVVTFHSLEDRIVKRFFASRAGRLPSGSRHLPDAVKGPEPSFELPFKGHLGAAEAEARLNPRARSAKLRAGIRTAAPPMPAIADEIGLSVQGARH